jgi:hypothetical protein
MGKASSLWLGVAVALALAVVLGLADGCGADPATAPAGIAFQAG